MAIVWLSLRMVSLSKYTHSPRYVEEDWSCWETGSDHRGGKRWVEKDQSRWGEAHSPRLAGRGVTLARSAQAHFSWSEWSRWRLDGWWRSWLA